MAKIATTIDHISNGRLYFGIGAGWKEVEYRAYGYPFPKPVQKPHIPIWVGGTGAFTLRVTAKHANACNFAWTLLPNAFKQKLEILRNHCSDLGRDYNSIRRSAAIMFTMAPTERELGRKLEDQEKKKDTPYMRYLGRQPPNLVGRPDLVAERMKEYVTPGVDHFILRFHFGDEISSMTLFMDKVKNRL